MPACRARSCSPCTDRGALQQLRRPSSVSSTWSVPPSSNHSLTWRMIGRGEDAAEHGADRGADDLAGDVVGAAQLAFVLELELAGDRRQRGVDVGDARARPRFARQQRAPLGVGDHVLEQRDRQPLADAGPLVDA